MKKERHRFIKNLRYICLIGVIALGLIMIVGSNGGDGGRIEGVDGGGSDDQEVILSDNSVALDDETTESLVSVSVDNSTLTFDSSTSILETLKQDDVVVIGVTDKTPYGLMRKVISITQEENQVVVETTQAKLTDLIEQGAISVSKTLITDDINTNTASIKTRKGVFLREQPRVKNARAAATAVEIDPDTELFNLELDGVVLYDDDGNENTTSDQIVADGGISFGLSFDLDIQINWLKVQSLSFTTTPWQTAEITISSSISKSIEKKVWLAEFYMAPITVTIPIPVPPFTLPIVMVPVVTLYVGLDGEVSVNMTTGVTESASLTSGLEYRNSEWGPVSDFDIDFDYQSPELYGSASVKGYVEPDFELLIYGVTGPYATLQGYLQLDADINDDPWWTLYAGIAVGAGVKVEVIGYEIVDFEIPDIISYEQELAQAETPFTFSSSDLEGTWYWYTNESGGIWEGWLEGTMVLDSSGNLTDGSYATSEGGNRALTGGSFSITESGTVTGSMSTSTGATVTYTAGKMNIAKTLVAAVYTADSGDIGTAALVKAGGTFSTTDLAGTWYWYTNESGGTWEGWSEGTMVLDSNGNLTDGSYTTSAGGNHTMPGCSFSITESGTVTGSMSTSTGATVAYTAGKMNIAKTLVAAVYTADSGDIGTAALVKAGGTFSTTDLAGTWYWYTNESGGIWEGWLEGTMVLDSSGNLTDGSYTTSAGGNRTLTGGSFSITESGTVTGSMSTSTGATVTYTAGKMNIAKTLVAAVYTADSGDIGTATLVKEVSQ